MTTRIEAEELCDLLRPGMRVFLTGGVNEPRELTRALAACPEACRGVRFVATLLPGMSGFSPPGESRLETIFMTRELLEPGVEERVDFLPMQYRDFYDHLAATDFDLVLTQLVPPPGGEGRCSLGPAVDFLPAALEGGRRVAAELNAALPAPPGAPSLPLDRVDFAIEVERTFPTQTSEPGPEARAIGKLVGSLIEDGDCLQTGIGALPDAVLGELGERNDLGFHSGMLTDRVLDLVERGVLTGKLKGRDTGRHTTGFLLGSERLYAWAEEAESLLLRPVSYTHDVRVLAQLDRLVAINSAVEVDLFGQVNAEMVEGRQISGTGGSVDFFRGAARSRGGRSIVALPATARKGTLSRIVPALETGTVATALRTDVDFVVTEHGIAELRGRTVEARAEALIEIADPRFRDELRDAWRSIRRR